MIFTIIVAFIIFGIVYSNTNIRLEKLEKRIKILEMPGQTVAPIAPVPQASAVVESALVQAVPMGMPFKPAAPELEEEHLGRTLGVIGVFAVLFGIGFFLKYAFDNNLISIAGRLFLGVIIGGLAIALGRLIKAKYENYGHVLSGGGIGILFVTAYTAHVLYQVISAPTAYVFFALIAGVSVALSIADKQMLMAGIGIAGGFLAPLLISFGGSENVSLLSYILILNIGVAAIAFRYRWLPLHYLSFIGTFLVVATEYGREAGGDHLTLFLFSSMYFGVFLAASVFHHIVRKESSTESDVFFVSANAGLYALLSYTVLHPLLPDKMGLFMLGLAIVYLILGYLSYTTNREDKLLNIALPLVGIVFLTIAIPLHFDGRWITAGWLVEAVCLALIDYAMVGKRLYGYAIFVYLLGALKLFIFDSFPGSSGAFVPVFNGRFALFAFAVACGLAIAYIIQKALDRDFKQDDNGDLSLHTLSVFVGGLSQVMAVFLMTTEIHAYFAGNNGNEERTVISVGWALYAAFLTVVGFVSHIRAARILGIVLFILTAAKVFVDLWEQGPLYRIVSSIVFGVIALAASFLYAKFKDRLKEVL